MEAAIIMSILGIGAKALMAEPTPPVQHVYSSQTSEEIYIRHNQPTRSIDWTKPGNFIVGDSPETGVQWVFLTD